MFVPLKLCLLVVALCTVFAATVHLYSSTQYSGARGGTVWGNALADRDGWDIIRRAMAAEHEKRTSQHKVCMLARTYSKQLAGLPTFLLCAADSGLGVANFRVFLIVTDSESWAESFIQVRRVASTISALVGDEDFATVLPVTRRPTKEQDYGYIQTDAALREHFYNASSDAPGKPYTCDYLIVTNGDNYYTRGFGLDLMHLVPNDLVIFDWISHYTLLETAISEPKVWGDGSGRVYEAAPSVSQIDLGACMWRLAFLRENELYYAISDNLLQESDGRLVVWAIRLTDAWKRLRKMIFIHQ